MRGALTLSAWLVFVCTPLVVACAPASIGEYPEGEGTDLPNRSPIDDAEEADAGSAAPANAKPTLTVTLSGSGTGSITSTPTGLTCNGTTCTGTFTKGAAVTLVPTPAAGAVFGGWTGACTGSGSCAPVVNANVAVTAEFLKFDGTWKGTYTNVRPASGCTFNNGGNLTVTLTPNATALASTANIDGLEIRSIPSCNVVDKRASTTTADLTSTGATVTGTWAFAVPGTSGPPLPFPFTATVAGTTMTGTWTCPNCTGSFTLTKQP
jgi:endoglucanase